MPSANDIRTGFLEFFAANGHQIVHSSPLVPNNDPTLMFTNAGMVQFKNVFTGVEKRPYSRAVTSQKCVRAGGKHNDLENVGHTARHHTFFEMLGNFSFGDYFKDQAIELSWKLITKEYGLPEDRLLVTVFSEDDQAFDLWKKIAGLPEDRIIRIATSDNFWSMGETGPCGPCSEIFYDHGDHVPGGPPGSPEEDGDRFIEIWNLVFMQFEQLSAEERIDLPKPSIDTGMGLERVTAVLQGTHDNYAIDILRALIEASAAATQTEPDGPHEVSHRVIADHLRACAFLMADGVLPSNEGRGYVLRRIMRRAMRHAHMAGATEPVMYRLVSPLVSMMGSAFPELSRAEALITETLNSEETKFKKLLERGLRLLDEETQELADGGELSGEVAFRLYDTYGFPLDLTQDALRSRGMSVDEAGFEAAMARQRAEARAAWAGSGDAATEQIWFEIREEAGATEFLGYESEEAEGQVTALVVDGARREVAQKGDRLALVVNQTPFYAESGGQIGDTGRICVDAACMRVEDTQKKLGDLHVHIGVLESGEINIGDGVRLTVDGARRSALRANHSATHLLHKALRDRLGDHISQKGSMVSDERLRFDISHPKAIDGQDIGEIEQVVNEQIRANTAVETRLMGREDAIKQGALALFGEKYGDEVRVVTMGLKADGSTYSTELCGGTHVRRTGDIGVFKVVAESAVAAGVRRIEALTGAAAFAHLATRDQSLRDTAAALRTGASEVLDRVAALLDERRSLEREITDLRKKLAAGGGASGAAPEQQDLGGIAYAPRLMENVPAKELRGMADEIMQGMGSGVVALVSVNDGKASLVVAVTEDLSGKHDAVRLVQAGAQAVGGKGGGGRADMAQAGGPDGARGQQALDAIAALLKETA